MTIIKVIYKVIAYALNILLIKEKEVCMRLFATVLSAVGSFFALTTSGASWIWWFDEAEMPESLIK